MSSRILPLVVLALCLNQPAVVRAQLTAEESKLFSQFLSEPDTKASFEKRLQLIGDAIERQGDPKGRLMSSIVVDLKRARVPAELGVPFLLKRLDHPSEAVRKTIFRMLGAYGAEGKSAVPAVLERMKQDPIRALRADAMLTLAKIDPGNAESAAAILDRLGADDADDVTNRAALQALAAMATVLPRSATPRIAKFQEHRLTDLGVLAHELIGKIVGLQRPTVEQLRAMTAIEWRKAPDQGYAVFASIAAAGTEADFAVPLVLGTLDSDPPPYLECVAIDTLAKLRTGNPQAIAALLERLTAKDPAIRTRARAALHQLDLKQPESVRALAAGLRHKDRAVQLDVAVTLRTWDDTGRLPPAAHAEMLPPLLDALGEANDMASPAHLEALFSLLRHFGKRAAPVAEPLVKLYQSEDRLKKLGGYAAIVRGKVLAVLANVGVPEAGRDLVLQALQKGPTNPPDGGFADGGYAYAAAARAAATFAEPKQAVPLLLPGLTVKGPERALYFIDWSGDGPARPTTVRLEAIRALARFGPGAEAALPALRDIAEGKPDPPANLDLLVYQEARRAFQAIAGTSLPPTPGVFADGKKEMLYLDERLKVKMTLLLQNARPPDVLKRLQKATALTFTMDENIDPDTPVWASMQSVQMPAWNVMRQLAAAPSIQGAWQDVGDGYRLIGKKKTADEKLAMAAKLPFPPFRDESEPPQKPAAENTPPAKEYAEDYHPAVKEKRQDTPGLILHGPDAAECVQFEPEGLRITLPLSYPKPRPGTGVTTDFGVKGDFEITVAFEVLPGPKTDVTAMPADLRLLIVPQEQARPGVWHKANQNRAGVVRVVAGRNHVGRFIANWTRWTEDIPTDKWGNESFAKVEQESNQQFPAAAASGRLRLVRSGSLLYFLASDGASKDFAFLDKREFGTRDLKNVRILGSTSGPGTALDFRVTDIRIRADGFIKSEAALPVLAAPEPATHPWLFALLVIAIPFSALVLSLGIWAKVRKRPPPATVEQQPPTATASPPSGTILFACHHCAKRLKARAASAGKKLKCPGCGALTAVPKATPGDAEEAP